MLSDKTNPKDILLKATREKFDTEYSMAPKTKVGWEIIDKCEYSEKSLSFLGSIPTKITGIIYILQHQVTGKLKFQKVILNKVRLFSENMTSKE